ncbi:MAG TPA: hypothetical protein VMJ75_16445, partial [Candidatus Acidoferrales bacterium]|nr:hypothetical protein [Candidatus Acidoferrales bacterium]
MAPARPSVLPITLGSDGESFNGGIIPIGGTNPKPKDATLTGTFSTTSINVNGVGPVTINSSFSVTFSDSPNLVDGDFGLITATTGTAASVPEPGAWTLLATCLLGVAITRPSVRRVLVRKQNVLPLALLACCLAAVQSASASVPTVNLTTWTTPDNGVAGVDSVNVVGSGFPSGTITPANIQVTFATSCGGAVSATASANSIKTVLGATKRVNVTIPGGLLTGTYFVQISDLSAGEFRFCQLQLYRGQRHPHQSGTFGVHPDQLAGRVGSDRCGSAKGDGLRAERKLVLQQRNGRAGGGHRERIGEDVD